MNNKYADGTVKTVLLISSREKSFLTEPLKTLGFEIVRERFFPQALQALMYIELDLIIIELTGIPENTDYQKISDMLLLSNRPVIAVPDTSVKDALERFSVVYSGIIPDDSDPYIISAIINNALRLHDSGKAQVKSELKLLSLKSDFSDDKAELSFSDLFDLEEIQILQDQFAAATGVASLITNPDGIPITRPSRFTRLCNDIVRKTEKGRANCFKSDAGIGKFNPDGPIIHECFSCGLWDAGASISVGGRHIANWLIGQVRNEKINEAEVIGYADEIGVSRQVFSESFKDVPFMDEERFRGIAEFLFSIANDLSLIAFQNLKQARYISERDKAEQELIQANREKELFLRDLQHRMKNTLTIISGLLSLEMANFNVSTIEEKKMLGIFEETIDRIEAISSIYQSFNSSTGLNHVELTPFIQNIVEQFKISFTRNIDIVRFESDMNKTVISIKTAMNIGLILNELLTNALKYAYPEGEPIRIDVNLKLNNQGLFVIVRDFGCGFKPGFSDKDKGTGLQIIDMLTQELDGRIKISGHDGVSAELRLPDIR